MEKAAVAINLTGEILAVDLSLIIGILNFRKGVERMKVKFNIAIRVENETTGEIFKNVKEDVYLDNLTFDTFNQVKGGLISSCDGMINIIKNIGS